jgi:hypothetical protein
MIVVLGAAACGDDVTVTEQTPPVVTPVVRSVVVSPSAATIATGASFTFGAAVDADAPLATTVTWTSSNTAIATVTAAGVATANAVAGVSSICATSTAATGKSACAQLTVTTAPAVQPATISIDAITIGCDAIASALAGANACSLTSPVATNNVFGEFQVRTNVNRPAGSTVTGVRLEVLNAATNIVEATQTQTLSSEPIVAEGLAAQTAANTVTFSVQSANYNTTTGAATHVNGQKRVRVSLVGGTSTASADRELTFRNANGFHITGAAIPALNGAGVASTAAVAGRLWTGGVPLTFTALPVSYTGVAVNATTLAISFGSTLCDLSGTGARTAATTANTATFAYTSAVTAAATSVNAYEFNPNAACAAANPLGEFPTANAVDANGNPFINIALGGVFGSTNNTLNIPTGPVVPTGATVPGLRLDNRAPAATINVQLNPNGRANNWYNDAVVFNTVNNATNTLDRSLAVTSTATDAGVGGAAFRARVGTNITSANASTDITNATTLAASATNTTYCLAQYAVDTFMNRTVPSACATTFGVDRAAPTATLGGIAANARLNGANIGGEITVALSDTGLVGNSGMNPVAPMVGSIVRRNAAAAVFCTLGTDATTACATQAPLAGLPTAITIIAAVTANGYYTFNGTAKDAAGNTTAVGPRVFVKDNTAPIIAIAGVPATVAATGYTATSLVSEDVDIQSLWFDVLYAAAPAPLDVAPISQAPVVVSTFPGIPATLQNANVPISQAITLPLAIQENIAGAGTTVAPQTDIWAGAFNQTNLLGSGAPTAPVVTPPTPISITPVGGWTSFGTPAAPVSGLSTGGPTAPTAGRPASTTLSITTTGPTATFNNPFTRVEFYALTDFGTYRLIGTATTATLTDNGATRTFTYSITATGASVASVLFGPVRATYLSAIIALGYGASNNVAMLSASPLTTFEIVH